MLMLVLPALVGMKDKTGPIWYLFKSFIQHSRYHVQNRPLRESIADQITTNVSYLRIILPEKQDFFLPATQIFTQIYKYILDKILEMCGRFRY